MPMKAVLAFCLLCIQLALCGSAYSQPVIINKGSRHYLQKIGTEEHKKLNPLGQTILKEYATALATNPANLNSTFQCEISRDATIAANNEATVRLRIINATVRGDASLKGFDISDVLVPTIFNAAVLLTTSKGDTLLYEQQQSLRLNKGNSAHIRFQVQIPPDTDTVWFEVHNLFFFHERPNVQQLISRVQKIADYYAADYLLKIVQEQLASVKCSQYDLLPQCFLVLIEVDRVLKHIGKANFSEHLSLGISDPVALQRRFELAANTHSYLMREFSVLLNQNNRIYLTQTEEALVQQYINGILRFIDDNPEPGFAAAPFINQLTVIDYSGKEFEQQANYFRQLAHRIYPGIPRANASAQLLSLIYNAMLSKANDFVEAVEFNKAVVLHENAGRFCEAFEEVDCNDNAYFELSKAKHGLYGFYLSVANRAIEMQRPDIGSSYVFLARDYQLKNKNLIIHNGEVMVMLVKLFDAYVVEAAKYNRAERYDSALILLNRLMLPDINITPSAAWHAQKSITLNGLLAGRLSAFSQALDAQPLAVTENLYHNLAQFINSDMHGIGLTADNSAAFLKTQQLFVQQLIIAARSDMVVEYFEESMRKLILTRSIIGKQVTDYSPEVDSLTLIAGREVVNRILRETVMLINQGKTDEGFELYSMALLRSEQYNLATDTITQIRLNDIYDAYLAIKCIQLQSRLDQVLQQAEKLAVLQMFIQLTDTLSMAIKEVSSLKACRLSLSAAETLISKYQQPYEFQRSLQLANRALAQNDFLTCLRNIELAEKAYTQNNLKEFGLEQFSMLGYATENANSALNWYIAGRFVQLQRFDEALTMLEQIREAGVPSSETESLQQEIGFLIGSGDKHEVGFFKSFSKPKEHTNGLPWYKPFNKAYRKGLGFSFPWLF